MNVIEAAKALKVHPNTIRAMCKNGELTAVKKGRSHLLEISETKNFYNMVNEVRTCLTVSDLSDAFKYSSGHIRQLLRRKIIIGKKIRRKYLISIKDSIKLGFIGMERK